MNVISILIAILVFAVMIFIHELGHFLAAKIFNVKVNEFAIGFGHAIFQKQGKETKYSLRILPVGGFCAFEGETQSSDDPRSLTNAKWYKKLIIVVAGALFNIILGFIVCFTLTCMTPGHYTTEIATLEQNSNMPSAGFEVGDKIVRLNNTSINIYDDISLFLAFNVRDDESVEVYAERDGKIIHSAVKPVLNKIRYNYFEDGVEVISEINGKTVINEKYPYNTDRSVYEKLIGTSEENSRYILGITSEKVPSSFSDKLHDAFFSTIYNVKLVYISLTELLRGNVALKEMSGPVGIVDMIGKEAQMGLSSLLSLVALLTVNLGVMNLLPIPALDGCKAIITVIEAIIRRKLPPEKEAIINLIGFACLIMLMIFVTYNDILKIIT